MSAHLRRVAQRIVKEFRANLFSRIVPNMKRVGLLDGWLAERFDEMDVLRFKDHDADAVLESLISGADVFTNPDPGATG